MCIKGLNGEWFLSSCVMFAGCKRCSASCGINAQTPLVRFVVDLLYNLLYPQQIALVESSMRCLSVFVTSASLFRVTPSEKFCPLLLTLCDLTSRASAVCESPKNQVLRNCDEIRACSDTSKMFVH